MDILYYNEPKSVTGGVSNVAYYLSKALAKRVNVSYFPSIGLKKGYLPSLFNVYRKFAMKKFDIIHFNNFPVWINGSPMLLKFARARGAHTIVNIHGLIGLEHKLEPMLGSVSPVTMSNILSSYKTADRVIVNSEYMRTNVAPCYAISRDKIVVIPNGIDLRSFSGCYHKLMLDGDPVVLYIGSLRWLKGIDILIRAIARLRLELPNMKLHLVGSGVPGYNMSDLQLLVKNEGVENFVVLHGWVGHSMVPCYYKSADLCVFPSRLEGFGIVILEAMASGTPIIASNISSFREILTNDKNSLLFENEDANALSSAILTLSQDSDMRKRIRQDALKTVEKYSWENIAEKYIDLYRHLCE